MAQIVQKGPDIIALLNKHLEKKLLLKKPEEKAEDMSVTPWKAR